MLQTLSCGCTVDDEKYSTVHEVDGSHYRLGLSPEVFCVRCDLFKPCACQRVALIQMSSDYQEYIRKEK